MKIYDIDSEPMDSSSMMSQATITDVTNANLSRQQLPDPLICASNPRSLSQQQSSSNMMSFNTQNPNSVLTYQGKMYDASNIQQTQPMASNLNQMNLNRHNSAVGSQIQSQQMLNQTSQFINANTNPTTIQSQSADMLNLTGVKKRPTKERGTRAQLFGRREPHNYDKTAPTQHQTNIYNQMLAQQNRNQQIQQMQQQQQQTQLTNAMSGINDTSFINSTNYMGTQNVQTPIQASTSSSYVSALNLTSNSNFNVPANQMSSNIMNMISNAAQQPQMQAQQTQSASVKPGSNLLSLLAMKNPTTSSESDVSQLDSYKMSSGSPTGAYKTYSMQQPMKSGSFQQTSQRNVAMATSTSAHQMNPLVGDRNQLNVAAIDKEMFRSKSLPMNSSLQLPVMRDESFAVPKYQASKASSNRIRARSNSMVLKQQHHTTQSLQSATSEPMLKTLQQLLTSTSTGGSSSVSNLQQSDVLQNAIVVSPNEINLSQTQPKSHQKPLNQFQSQYSSQFAQPLSPDNKFTGSPGGSGTPGPSSLSPGSSGESMQRRVGHIHAEQKRRYNIKNGFDMLHTLIPQLQQNPNAKLSKAAMLQKGAEYIKQLRSERDAVNQKMDVLRKERDALNNSLK